MIPDLVWHFSCVAITVRVAQICTSLPHFHKHSYSHLRRNQSKYRTDLFTNDIAYCTQDLNNF